MQNLETCVTAVNDLDAYVSAASILSGFGITVFMFRIQRELQMEEKGERMWLSYADYLVVVAITISSIVLGSLMLWPKSPITIEVGAALCASAAVLLMGYPFAIMAHYRFHFGKKGRGRLRKKGEVGELFWILFFGVAATVVFVYGAKSHLLPLVTKVAALG